MDLLNLEKFESSTAVAINDPKSKPLKFVSIKWHDSNQAFDKLPLSAFSKEQLSNFISSNSALMKLQFFREQFLKLQLFFSRSIAKPMCKYTMRGQELEVSARERDLGIQIKENLNWEIQMGNAVTKGNKILKNF